jgi:hypothetical protein
MAQIFKNNVEGVVAAGGLAESATTLSLVDASLFPDPGTDWYLATLSDAAETAWEIVKVTAKAGNDLTIVRAQESTTDVAWAGGSKVSMRPTAGMMETAHTPVAISDTTPAEAAPFWFKSDTGQLLVSYDGTYVEPASGVSIGMPTAGTAGQMLVKTSGDDFDTEWTNSPVLSNYIETSNTETLTADTTLDLADGPIQFLTINPAGASVAITMPAAAAGKSLTLIVTNSASKAHTWAASPAIVWMSESDDATPPTPAADGDRTSYGFISDGTVWLGWLTGKEVSA